MPVREWMSGNVAAIEAVEPMQRATAVMKGRNVRMLPVVSDGRLDLERTSEPLVMARGTVGSPALERHSWYA